MDAPEQLAADALPASQEAAGDVYAPYRDPTTGRMLTRPPGVHRTHGSKGKIKAAMHQMIADSLDELGGVDYLVRCGRSKVPTIRAAYLGLVKAIIPRQVVQDVGPSLEAILQAAHDRNVAKRATIIDMPARAALPAGDETDEPED